MSLTNYGIDGSSPKLFYRMPSKRKPQSFEIETGVSQTLKFDGNTKLLYAI